MDLSLPTLFFRVVSVSLLYDAKNVMFLCWCSRLLICILCPDNEAEKKRAQFHKQALCHQYCRGIHTAELED